MTASEANTIEARRRHHQELAARRVEDDPVVRRWHVAKRIVWMIALAAAFLFYYLIDKLREALTILG
jgi:hypothetical protein